MVTLSAWASSAVSGRDTAYVWVGRDAGGQPGRPRCWCGARVPLLLGGADARAGAGARPRGRPVVRVDGCAADAAGQRQPHRRAGGGRRPRRRPGRGGRGGGPPAAGASRWPAAGSRPPRPAWVGDRPERRPDGATSCGCGPPRRRSARRSGRGCAAAGCAGPMPGPTRAAVAAGARRPAVLRVGHPRRSARGACVAGGRRPRASAPVDVEVVQRPGHGGDRRAQRVGRAGPACRWWCGAAGRAGAAPGAACSAASRSASELLQRLVGQRRRRATTYA